MEQITAMENTNDNDPFSDEEPKTETKPAQFGIAAIFWLTFIVGLGISYLQRLDSPDIIGGAAIALLIAVVAGVTIGAITKRIPDALFWSTLIAAFGYISVAGDPIFTSSHRLVWAGIGASCGAIAATCFPKRLVTNSLLCIATAGAIMFVFWWRSESKNTDMNLDVIVAPVIGLGIAVFVRLVSYIEAKRQTPRYISATCLLVVVILANMYSNWQRFG